VFLCLALHNPTGYETSSKSVGISKSKLSMYLHADLPMPAHIEERILNRLAQELETIRQEHAPALQGAEAQ
jgi:hypothetical protein